MNVDGPVRILSVCDDEELRSSREQVLRVDGYQIESYSSEDSFAARQVRSFDMAVICQSVNQDQAARLAEMLTRHHPGLRILRLSSSLELDCLNFGQPRPYSFLKAMKSLITD
jgi:DNA-binding NtrC family response regulator